PVVSCAGVLAYVRARKKSATTKVLWVCFFMAFVPVLNSAFYALNSSYYARWFYMPILLMCAATMQARCQRSPRRQSQNPPAIKQSVPA
ncbi:MAG: hypothetical protein RSB47_09410, partial [Ruthenibacterium sp.]